MAPLVLALHSRLVLEITADAEEVIQDHDKEIIYALASQERHIRDRQGAVTHQLVTWGKTIQGGSRKVGYARHSTHLATAPQGGDAGPTSKCPRAQHVAGAL